MKSIDALRFINMLFNVAILSGVATLLIAAIRRRAPSIVIGIHAACAFMSALMVAEAWFK